MSKELVNKLASIVKKQQKLIQKMAESLDLVDSNDAAGGPVSNLPADLASALAVGAPTLKGALNLEVKGQTVSVRYNADMVRIGATKVKQAVEAALAGTEYQVVGCIGEFNPQWQPNFV
jgi:hypothetical protein